MLGMERVADFFPPNRLDGGFLLPISSRQIERSTYSEIKDKRISNCL
jgi:hypothetical protein